MDPAIALLDRIRALYQKLHSLSEKSPEYEATLDAIYALSAQYMALIEASKKNEENQVEGRSLG